MFQDLKVLELASVLAGPSVGQFFAELGADVVKIENLKAGGDVTRTWKSGHEKTDDRSAYFCAVNWGKRSVAVDLDSKSGLDVVRKLAQTSDVVIASYKPGDARKLGVDYESLAGINPSLIYGQVTGYGSSNPRVGYDAVVQAESGFMFMNGSPGGPPLKMPVALIDVLAAHQLKEGLLLAIIKKQRQGEGSFVEVSLFDAALSALVNQATNWLVGGTLPQKQGSAHPNIAPYGDTFTTRDGDMVLLAVGSDKQFAQLCEVIERPEMKRDPLFITNGLRVANRNALNEAIQNQIDNIATEKLMSALHQRKIPAGVIRNMREVFALPESDRVKLCVQPLLTGVRSFVCEPFISQPLSILPPPHFGEHTAEILALLD